MIHRFPNGLKTLLKTGEISCFGKFLHVQHCFQGNDTWDTFNHRFVWEGVNHSNEFDGQLGKEMNLMVN